jgi:hypothetical protein
MIPTEDRGIEARRSVDARVKAWLLGTFPIPRWLPLIVILNFLCLSLLPRVVQHALLAALILLLAWRIAMGRWRS